MTDRIDHDIIDDDIFEENLKRAGRVLDMPAPPSIAQRARWRNAPAPDAEATCRNNGRLAFASAASRGLSRTFISRGLIGGALAASIVIVAWLSVDRHHTVSAQTILNGLAETMTRSVWVELENIDLGSVIFNGRLYWGEPDEHATPREYYSEVYADVRPDNPQWDLYDVISVIYQSDDKSWQFHRGSGTSGHLRLPDGRLKINAPESFSHVGPAHDLRESFEFPQTLGAMPMGVGVGSGESGVRYEVSYEQLDVISQTMDWIRDLHEAYSPQLVVEQLERIAQESSIASIDRTTLHLVAHDLRLDAIEEYHRQTDETVIAERDMTTSYDAARNWLGRSGGHIRPKELSNHRAIRTAIREIMAELDEAGTSAEKVLAVYQQYTDTVELTTADDGSWSITARDMRIHGVKPSLPPGARPLPELLRNSTLVVRFDLIEQRVIDAEFQRIGGEGVIRIRNARERLDSNLTNPDRWEARLGADDQ